jgi:tetratricopeptide (TPR) repeat protein
MKIKVLMAALLGLVTVSAFAQKGELSNAQTQYEKYDGLVRANYTLAKPSLAEAKTSIDKASTNAKTATLPQTYALKAAIYASIALKDSVATSAATETATAVEAIKKAKETDTKNEYSKLIQHASLELAQIQLDKGVKAYQSKDYDGAYKAFDAAQQIIPGDTTAILYTAVSASNAKNYPAAIANYNKLLATNYSAKDKVYADMPTMYLLSKDTAGAIKIAGEAVAKYPTNASLRKEEIEVSLQGGQQNDLITKIETAIKADPNNKTLHYYKGLTYSQIAEGDAKEVRKLKKADSKNTAAAKPGAKPAAANPQIAKLDQAKNDNFNNAADEYKKALEIDQNYFEAVLNLGYVLISPAIDAYNDAQQLPMNQKKAYDDAMAKATAQFAAAKPHVLKAVELNPQSIDALTNLKSYYLGVKDTENANAVQKKIDALPEKK